MVATAELVVHCECESETRMKVGVEGREGIGRERESRERRSESETDESETEVNSGEVELARSKLTVEIG